MVCMKYAHENGGDLGDCVYSAPYYGHLECLKYVHQNGCRMDSVVVSITEARGHIECLQYAQLHEISAFEKHERVTFIMSKTIQKCECDNNREPNYCSANVVGIF